jgi:hypothetical protein
MLVKALESKEPRQEVFTNGIEAKARLRLSRYNQSSGTSRSHGGVCAFSCAFKSKFIGLDPHPGQVS